MSLEKVIINLEMISTIITLMKSYNKDILNNAILQTNLTKAEHYLGDTLTIIEKLKDIEFVKFLDVDLEKCISYTEDMYYIDIDLTKDIVDFNKEEDF